MRDGSPPPNCHVSGVTCHVLHVIIHVSPVTCQIQCQKKLQSGEASQLRVCYQRGIPRLVSIERL